MGNNCTNHALIESMGREQWIRFMTALVIIEDYQIVGDHELAAANDAYFRDGNTSVFSVLLRQVLFNSPKLFAMPTG